MSAAGPYSIGSSRWPGLSKLIEECGEVQQVAGKILGTGGEAKHWDGTDLRDRIHEEIGDVIAACQFVAEANDLDGPRIAKRVYEKLGMFRGWHREQTNRRVDASAELRPILFHIEQLFALDDKALEDLQEEANIAGGCVGSQLFEMIQIIRAEKRLK